MARGLAANQLEPTAGRPVPEDAAFRRTSKPFLWVPPLEARAPPATGDTAPDGPPV